MAFAFKYALKTHSKRGFLHIFRGLVW